MTFTNQRKQLMNKGFLYCAVALVIAICGIAPATAQFPPPPPLPTPPAEAQPSPAPSKGKKVPGLQTLQSSEIGAVNSPRSAAKRPISSSSSLAPEGQRQPILTSTAQESLLASGRRNPMPSSSKSSLRAQSTKVGAVPTVLSRLRERVTIWRCSGWQYRIQHNRRLRHALKKVAWKPMS